jgi:transposase-like protein
VANDVIETQHNVSALAREHGVSRTTVRRWLANGWTPQLPAPGRTADSADVIEGEIV